MSGSQKLPRRGFCYKLLVAKVTLHNICRCLICPKTGSTNRLASGIDTLRQGRQLLEHPVKDITLSCVVLVVPTLALAKVGTTLRFTECTGWAWDHWRGHLRIER